MSKLLCIGFLGILLIMGCFTVDASADNSGFGASTATMGGAAFGSGSPISPTGAAKPHKPVPEPSSLLLLASGMAGLIAFKVRLRKK